MNEVAFRLNEGAVKTSTLERPSALFGNMAGKRIRLAEPMAQTEAKYEQYRSGGGGNFKTGICCMLVRLLEMHRMLNNAGSAWLHCGRAASHCWKRLTDPMLGRKNSRNVIVRFFGASSDHVESNMKSQTPENEEFLQEFRVWSSFNLIGQCSKTGRAEKRTFSKKHDVILLPLTSPGLLRKNKRDGFGRGN